MHILNIDSIVDKAFRHERLSLEEALFLTENISIPKLGSIANDLNSVKNHDKVFFNRNIHIEPTNICVNHCLFCSYRRRKGEEGSWEYSVSDMLKIAEKAIQDDPKLTEFHLVGGVHPDRGLAFYLQLIAALRKSFPQVHIKAFTAEEIVQMCKVDEVDLNNGLQQLIDTGLDSMPGGGAEIFKPEIRRKICPDKISGDEWLHVHQLAHEKGIYTNATMLYGHYDTMRDRLEHLEALRTLQDKTGMFNAFIPLKFKAANNKMSHLGEVDIIEDIKTYAISRIFLDNISNIKAYWPMLGIDQALLLLHFGVNDVDGTIADTTKIYSMAGSKKNPSMHSEQLVALIKKNNKIPVERNSVYDELKIYS
ncbi:MAG: aminofutalosine synthase MqnE [Salinivirgaceae bacterium]|nr:MAG: aminofutalosine synthase MqnE [Salinivirgaceae bacterium]